ncbi:MAG TPA: glycogen/starch/alpha-glucan phosphorylase, partial [Blastocatellia bacterium]|nr:glycogen/starch/alpha-glucan phosphorylase [Blastocatellia bacterium]
VIGDDWIVDLDCLQGLEAYAFDSGFQSHFTAIKRANKERLAAVIRNATSMVVDPDSLFDVQVKRFHLYKRQLLNVLRIVHEYLCLVEDGKPVEVPRTYVFSGKAAPGYWEAKQTIKLIDSVGKVINNDPRLHGMIKVVLIPDYKVSLAEAIIPAANLSEQISTAGMEASGTGNMKFAMNGALTVGTLDGANVEIKDEVGEDNIYIFGLKAEEIRRMREEHSYHPRQRYEMDLGIKRVVDSFLSDRFCPDDPGIFAWIFDLLTSDDWYFHLADLPLYIDTQARVAAEFRDPQLWTRKAILNVARIGKFSSDRTIQEYASDVWHLSPV